jgi:hypothetical protein
MDQNVGSAEPFVDLSSDPGPIRVVCDVGSDCDSAISNFGGGLVRLGPIDDHDRRSACCQQIGHAAADTLLAAGYDRDFPLVRIHIFTPVDKPMVDRIFPGAGQ